jgi:sugar/nucleoside kinase (ribokinase family)
MKVGIVTSWGEEVPLGRLDPLPICNYKVGNSTTFHNKETAEGRKQTVYHVAPPLTYAMIPDIWKNTPIIHLGPIAQDVSPEIVKSIDTTLLGISAQGWLRTWDDQGNVKPVEWAQFKESDNYRALSQINSTIISIEDIGRQEERVDDLVQVCEILVVTEAEKGSRLYWNGKMRHFPAPKVEVVDPVGAGDVYATAFFVRLYQTQDPNEAARFATQLAAFSVTRRGLDSAPPQSEIDLCLKGIA